MKYQLEEIQDLETWDSITEKCVTSTIFHKSSYFESFCADFRLFRIVQGTQEKGGVLCFVDADDQNKMRLHDSLIHNGIIIRDDFVGSNYLSKIHSATFEILESCISALDECFQKIQFSLTPAIKDMRPFLWHNYHSGRADDKFKIVPRYTSYISLETLSDHDCLSECDFFLGLSKSRKQEIRYALANQVLVEQSDNFDDFYLQYFEQACKYNPSAAEVIRGIKKVRRSMPNQIVLFQVKDGESVSVGYAMFGLYKTTAYYLFGVTSKESRERYSGSFLLWKSFKYLKKMGIKLVDTEGVNSPKRGWFKLSFGGLLKTYYHVTYERAEARGELTAE